MLRLARSGVLLIFWVVMALAALPRIGERAPQFRLPSSSGGTVALKDYVGKSKVVLVFYRGYW